MEIAASLSMPRLYAVPVAARGQLASLPAMVIAIDGPAGAGKSTVARAVAERARLHVPRHGRDVPLRRAGS